MPKNANGAPAATRKSAAKPKSPAQAPEQREEAIRQRAYELYLSRQDGSNGSEMDDWLQAERELGTPATTTRRAPARRKS